MTNISPKRLQDEQGKEVTRGVETHKGQHTITHFICSIGENTRNDR